MSTLPAIVKALGKKVIYHNKDYYVIAGAIGLDVWRLFPDGKEFINLHSTGRMGEEGLRRAKAFITSRIQEKYKYF